MYKNKSQLVIHIIMLHNLILLLFTLTLLIGLVHYFIFPFFSFLSGISSSSSSSVHSVVLEFHSVGYHKKFDGIDRESIVTIFGQGNGASRAQCAKYTSKGIMVNNQLVYIPNAPDLLFNPFIYPELDDIGYSPGLNIFYYVHHLFSWFKTFYFNSFGESTYHVHFTEVNIAGRDDIRQHQAAIRNCSRQNPEKNIVLYGVSRGASMTFLSIATLPEEERKNVKLVILEAPFDTVPNVVNYRSGFMGPINLAILEMWTKYDPSYITPLDSVATFPLDIPVVFITSLKDRVVHHTLTQNLIDGLKKRGHPAIHHLMLTESSHTAMSFEEVDEGNSKYYQFISRLYRKYFPKKKECVNTNEKVESHQPRVTLVVSDEN